MSTSETASKMRVRSVPTSRTVPASTASGRSVTFRMTKTGLPSEGASSWMPPESVRITCDFCIRWTKGR